MNGGDSDFTARKKSGDDLFLSIDEVCHLSLVVGWDSTHIVVDGGHNWSWLLRNIDICEDLGGLSNAWQSLVEDSRVEMVQMQIHVIFLRSTTSSLNNFHSHRSADYVSGGQILG